MHTYSDTTYSGNNTLLRWPKQTGRLGLHQKPPKPPKPAATTFCSFLSASAGVRRQADVWRIGSCRVDAGGGKKTSRYELQTGGEGWRAREKKRGEKEGKKGKRRRIREIQKGGKLADCFMFLLLNFHIYFYSFCHYDRIKLPWQAHKSLDGGWKEHTARHMCSRKIQSTKQPSLPSAVKMSDEEMETDKGVKIRNAAQSACAVLPKKRNNGQWHLFCSVRRACLPQSLLCTKEVTTCQGHQK